MKKSGKAYYMISAVAQKYNIHPQTLRLYEREGLLKQLDAALDAVPEGQR